MKTILKTTVLATSLILALSACSEKEKQKNAAVIHADSTMKADELADAGEQLVSPYTFMLSDKVFDMALEKDPTNKKAQFYKSFVKRLMVLKGIGRRIAPLVKNSTPKQIEDYERWKKDFPESPLKKFLMDGPEDIQSYSQIVSVLSDYNMALNDFRKFLKLNASLELTLNLNPHIFEKEINEELVNSCTWTNEKDKAYVVECNFSQVAQKKINAADMIALRQITGGEMLYWSMYTAYDLSTIEQISKNETLKNMSPPQVLAYYKSLPSIAKLNKTQTLSLIPELGSDFSAAVKWAKQYQDRMCPKGSGSRNQRRGFLFKDGICVESNSDSEKSLALVDQALGGVFTQPILNDQDQQVDQIRVNLVGFLKNPPQDLKNILPDAVDLEGKVTRWSDATFGGLFPDGDIQKLDKKN